MNQIVFVTEFLIFPHISFFEKPEKPQKEIIEIIQFFPFLTVFCSFLVPKEYHGCYKIVFIKFIYGFKEKKHKKFFVLVRSKIICKTNKQKPKIVIRKKKSSKIVLKKSFSSV